MSEGEPGVGGNQELCREAERPQEAAPELLLPRIQLTSPPLLPVRQAGLPTISGTAHTHTYLHTLALFLPPSLLYKLYPLQEAPLAVL